MLYMPPLDLSKIHRSGPDFCYNITKGYPSHRQGGTYNAQELRVVDMTTGAKGVAHVAMAALDFTESYIKVSKDIEGNRCDVLVTRSHIVKAAYYAVSAADCAAKAAETYARLADEYAGLSVADGSTEAKAARRVSAAAGVAARSVRGYASISRTIATKVIEDIIEGVFESDRAKTSVDKLVSSRASTIRSATRPVKEAINRFNEAVPDGDSSIHADVIAKAALRAAGDLESIAKIAAKFTHDLLEVSGQKTRPWA